MGGNLYGSNPDSGFAAEALQRLDTAVYVSTTLNTGHEHGTAGTTVILPALARDEEPQCTTQESMFNYVRVSSGGPSRHDGPRSESEIVADLAERTVAADGPVDWTRMRPHDKVREWIADLVPGYEQADAASDGEEFTVQGRVRHESVFATPDGKARMNPVPVPAERAVDELRLMTIRSERQFNTVVYEEHDRYRGLARRDVVLIHTEDLARRSLTDGQEVVVRSGTAEMTVTAVSFPTIRKGNAAMYFPEANVLVPRDVDPRSKTPSFKNVAVTVRSAE